MSRPWLCQHLGRSSGLRRHFLRPLGPFGVGDFDGDGRAQRAAVADAPEKGDLVGLEAHARASAVPQAAPRQLVADVGGLDRQTGREPLHDHDERTTVGLSSGQKAQHTATLPDGPRRLGAAQPEYRGTMP